LSKKAKLSPEQRYANKRACQEDYRHCAHRFTLQFSLQDTEAYEWFASHSERGKYLKALILADKEKQMLLSAQTKEESDRAKTTVDYVKPLYDKVQMEYNIFMEELNRMTPEQIIERAYEKVMKENIVMAIQDMKFTSTEAKALFREKYPLDRIYREWLDTNISDMQILKDSISDTAKKAVKKMKEKRRECR